MLRVWVVIFLAGCAHSPPPPPPPVCEPCPSPSPAPVENPPRSHGDKRGATEPIALPYRLVDGNTLQPIDDFAARVKAARVIYIGESHDDPHHHAAERELLEKIFAAEPSTALALGIEMLPRALQAPLDAYVAGGDEAAFLDAVEWKKTWGFPFGLYRPLFELARENKLRVRALNAPKSLTRAVAKNGLEALSPDEKKQLPQMVPGPPAHREMVREAFGAHASGRFPERKFERFYLAQLIWDETMAESIAAILDHPLKPPRRVLVVAGELHVRRHSIPERAARRGARPYLIVLPIFESDLDQAQGYADVLWVLGTR